MFLRMLKKSCHLMISLLKLIQMFHVNKVVHAMKDLLTETEEDSLKMMLKSFKR